MRRLNAEEKCAAASESGGAAESFGPQCPIWVVSGHDRNGWKADIGSFVNEGQSVAIMSFTNTLNWRVEVRLPV